MMLQKIGFLTSGLFLFASCGSNSISEKQEVVKKDTVKVAPVSKCEALFKEAKDADDVLLRSNVINKDDAARAVIAFYNYANLCKDDSLAPVFFLKAGQVAQSVGNFTQAQAFFVKCKDEFPDFKNRGAAIFLLAQLFDDPSKLNNEEEASTLYRQIVREYPNSSFAEDSKAAIKNLGKTDEELVKEFLKKNK
jgi:tetratricopeptide (TPR) repeat protein